MAFLNENEWILLNEIAYNISFIYTVEEMQKEILTRWLPFLISFDGATFSRLQWDREGNYAFYEPVMDRISPETQRIWVEESTQSDQFRWIMYASRGITFRESISDPESTLKESKLYATFYQPNHFGHSLGLSICFREELVGILRLYRREEKPPFQERDMFVLDQLHKHFAYRLVYEAKKGDTRYFFAKGYHEKLCHQFGLTSREGEMLDLAVHGLDNEEIAQKMNISIHTVKKHFHSIYEKMHVKNRVQMLQCLPMSTNKIDYDSL